VVLPLVIVVAMGVLDKQILLLEHQHIMLAVVVVIIQTLQVEKELVV
jgi:hypothetical protein